MHRLPQGIGEAAKGDVDKTPIMTSKRSGNKTNDQ
jgi:hypothetical protein